MGGWGVAADWVAAVATVGALIAAVVAGRTAVQVYRMERARDDRATAAELRADAVLVHSWTASWFDDEGNREDGLVISNTSENPVFDVQIKSVHYSMGQWPILKLTVLPPGRYFVERTNTKYNWGFPNLLEQKGGVIRPIMKQRDWRVVCLSFTDVRGAAWVREEGRLSEGSGPIDLLSAPGRESDSSRVASGA